MPAPRDPEIARKMVALRGRVDRLQAQQNLGRYQGIDEARALVAAAAATGHAPLRVQAHSLLSQAYLFLHDGAQAERELLQMARLAAAAGDDRGLVRSMSRLAMALEFQDKSEQALAMSRAAEVVARRAGNDEFLTYAQLTTGGVLQSLGRLDEATAAFEQALATVERTAKHADQSQLILPLAHLAAAADVEGRHDQARALLDQALAIAVASLGVDHPRTLQLLRTTAVAAEGQGRLDEALALGRRALALLEAAGRRADPDAVAQLADNAGFERQLGDYLAAERLYQEALIGAERSGSPRTLPQILRGLGDVRLHQGRVAEAEALYRRALAVTPSPAGGGGVGGHGRLGKLFQTVGRFEQARDHLRRALALRTELSGTRHPQYGVALAALGTLEALAGRCPVARPLAEEARTVLEASLGQEHPRVAEPLTALGRCALAERRPGEALGLLERALAVLEKAPLAPQQRGVPRALLARALAETDPQGTRAGTEAERAEAELAAGAHDTAAELADLRRWRERSADLPTGSAPSRAAAP